MAISELNVAGYRSIRSLRLPLARVNVLVGPNGCGKTNLYRSIFLVRAAAEGRLASALVEEGGMPSALWAGTRKRDEGARMALRVTLSDVEYALECGLPTPDRTEFNLDPCVKGESIVYVGDGGRVPLLERGTTSAWARDAEGRRFSYPLALSDSESVLAQLQEPHRFPQISRLRQEILGWRFYHQFRTDAGSPIREPRVGIRTPVLGHDGRDLAAALQTIREIGDWKALNDAVERAFPGGRLHIRAEDARFSFGLETREFQRPFWARELSDGTLRYFCLLAALLSPRPPAVLALNEPETSIHPDLLEPLAELMADAARSSQLWITTHSEVLAERLGSRAGTGLVRLEKVDGETRIVGQGALEGAVTRRRKGRGGG